MRIGILTFHRPCNFGANLQAFTSSHYFMTQGHQVSVINYIRDVDVNYSGKVPREQFDAHTKFVEDNLPLTQEVRTPEQLQHLVENNRLELIVIGADAVWRSPSDEEDIFFAKWLFEDKSIASIPVISMAAAHMGGGFADLSVEHRNSLKESLLRFKYITVRDKWTATVINRDIFEGEDKVTKIIPDPVFMLNKLVSTQWDFKDQSSKGYIAMTLPLAWDKGRIFGPYRRLWFSRFKKLVHRQGLNLVELPLPEGKSGMPFDYTVPYPIEPIQWFHWIKNARAFVGLRFHAIVSSISSGTPFFSLDTYGASASMRNYVMSMLGFRASMISEDKRSKIFNLLKGSGFEIYRVSHFLESIGPQKLISKINRFDLDALSKFCEEKQGEFKDAMAEGVALSQNKGRLITGLKDNCTGCFACMNACPVKAITLPENEEGFYFPKVDYSTCINCGLCDKTCPVLNPSTLDVMKKAWYGWAKDDNLRRKSSSGGVFGLLARKLIEEGGVVYGASFNYGDCLRLESHSSEEVGLDALLKSKYVQSYVGEVFLKIKKDLENGKKVLFCGTPCQVDGLRHYLNKNFQNLLVADFVCHGVPSIAILREHLAMLQIENVENIDYRPKNRNWVDDIVIKHDGGKVYLNYWGNDANFRSFEKARSLRRSCYNCTYCNGSRAADITLADFWGYRNYDPSIYDQRGISMVLANTEVGIETIDKLSKTGHCVLTEMDTKYAEYAYFRQRNGENGYEIEKRNAFFKDVNDIGYAAAIAKHCPIPKKTLYTRLRGGLARLVRKFKG